MYERSKHVSTFKIAGFQRYDGALVLNRMHAGDVLELVPEWDNPHDSNAIAVCYHGTKLGYIPRNNNEFVAQLLYFGHAEVFELRVLKVDERADPWDQVLVALYVADAR